MVRLKHRYVMGQVLADPTSSSTHVEITSRDIQAALNEMIQSLYGDVGTGSFGSNTSVKFYEPSFSIYVIRTSREHLNQVQFALTCMNSVKKYANLVLRTIEVAGSARTCKVKLRDVLWRCVNLLLSSESEKDELRHNLNDQIERLEI